MVGLSAEGAADPGWEPEVLACQSCTHWFEEVKAGREVLAIGALGGRWLHRVLRHVGASKYGLPSSVFCSAGGSSLNAVIRWKGQGGSIIVAWVPFASCVDLSTAAARRTLWGGFQLSHVYRECQKSDPFLRKCVRTGDSPGQCVSGPAEAFGEVLLLRTEMRAGGAVWAAEFTQSALPAGLVAGLDGELCQSCAQSRELQLRNWLTSAAFARFVSRGNLPMMMAMPDFTLADGRTFAWLHSTDEGSGETEWS